MLDGEELASQESGNEAPAASDQDHSTGAEQPQEQAPSNPFWGEVEQLTGPNVYKLIQPHLAKTDAEYNRKITEVNQSYAPWKAFADQGITPEHVQQSVGVVRQLNEHPELVYEGLRSFLEREGRLPSNQELANEVEEGVGEEVDPRDQELQALKEQQEQIQQFLQDQQMQAQRQVEAQQADTWMSSEITRIQATHKDLEQADMQEIVSRAAAVAQQYDARGQAVPDDVLEKATQQFIAMRDRIRTTPRPSSMAPRIPSGPGGSAPSTGGPDVGSMTKTQRQELVAQRLAAANQQA